MDMGVALVQAYLRVHRYLIVSEHPTASVRTRGGVS